MPGDTAIACKTEVANWGDIVIASADDEQTIKRFERRTHQARLVRENDTVVAWCPAELDIIGMVTGVVRRVRGWVVTSGKGSLTASRRTQRL